MKRVIIFLGIFSFFGISIFLFTREQGKNPLISPIGQLLTEDKPLEKYYFENLRSQNFPGSEIKMEKILKKESNYTSWLFSFQADGKRVTGMADIPNTSNSLTSPASLPPRFPVIIMLRGYADDEIYFTGLGTRKAAGIFADNGFITLAPDFLGFGSSDPSSADILEARFERPASVLNLLASVKNLPQANPDKFFLWGHSNGGQVALSVLEISQKPIPTALWAPVTQGFPQSVLQYIGELDDQGLKVKNAISQFQSRYDTSQVSIDNYFNDITAPIQLHQGGKDPLVTEEMSSAFVDKMKSLGKEITYYKYPKSNHNLEPDWDAVIARNIEFFRSYLK